jgi:hypothetical protein
MIYLDTKAAVKTLKALNKTAKENMPVALSRAINDAMRQTTTAAKREVTGRYNVYANYIQAKQLKQGLSKPTKPTATLNVANKQLPVIAFKGVRQDAKETRRSKAGTSVFSKLKNRSKKTGGVTVEIIKGQKTRIRSAFIATMKSGHVGVFGRGEYGSPFKWRKERQKDSGNDNPIQELNALTIATSFLGKQVQKRMERKATEVLASRLAHHLKFLAQ